MQTVSAYLMPSPAGKVAAKPTDEEIILYIVLLYDALLIHRCGGPLSLQGKARVILAIPKNINPPLNHQFISIIINKISQSVNLMSQNRNKMSSVCIDIGLKG